MEDGSYFKTIMILRHFRVAVTSFFKINMAPKVTQNLFLLHDMRDEGLVNLYLLCPCL